MYFNRVFDAGLIPEFGFFPCRYHLFDVVPAGQEHRPVVGKRIVFAAGNGERIDDSKFPIVCRLLFSPIRAGYLSHSGFKVADRIADVQYRDDFNFVLFGCITLPTGIKEVFYLTGLGITGFKTNVAGFFVPDFYNFLTVIGKNDYRYGEKEMTLSALMMLASSKRQNFSETASPDFSISRIVFM